jgi:hypothetical protein
MSVHDFTTILEEGFVWFMVFNATFKNISVIWTILYLKNEKNIYWVYKVDSDLW